jgi:hypothetical protein
MGSEVYIIPLWSLSNQRGSREVTILTCDGRYAVQFHVRALILLTEALFWVPSVPSDEWKLGELTLMKTATTASFRILSIHTSLAWRQRPTVCGKHVNMLPHSTQKTITLYTTWSWGSSVSIVIYCGPEFYPRQRQRIFILAPASRPALGPTQNPLRWVRGVLSPGLKRGRAVMLTTHPHLVPRLRMSRRCSYSPHKRLHGV